MPAWVRPAPAWRGPPPGGAGVEFCCTSRTHRACYIAVGGPAAANEAAAPPPAAFRRRFSLPLRSHCHEPTSYSCTKNPKIIQVFLPNILNGLALLTAPTALARDGRRLFLDGVACGLPNRSPRSRSPPSPPLRPGADGADGADGPGSSSAASAAAKCAATPWRRKRATSILFKPHAKISSSLRMGGRAKGRVLVPSGGVSLIHPIHTFKSSFWCRVWCKIPPKQERGWMESLSANPNRPDAGDILVARHANGPQR